MRKDRIKILFTIPNFDTAGSGKALLNIATRLDKDIFEPHIACFNDKGYFFRVVKDSGIPVHIIDYTHPMTNKIEGLKHCFNISTFFRKNKFDIVHSFHYGSDYSEALAARMAGVKWVFTKKNMSWGGGSARSWKLRTLLASAIVYQNSDMKSRFFKSKKNLYFIPRSVVVDDFNVEAGKDEERIKEEFGIRDNDKVIICVANLDAPVKGVEVLINAFAKIAEEKENVKLLLVGYDLEPYADLLKDMAKQTGHGNRIIFTGKRPEVKTLLSLSDVFVLPTLHKGEGSPVSLLEAMVSGVLVLGSDVPGIRDQLRDFNHLMFEPGDADMLHERLSWVLNLQGEEKNSLVNELKKNVKKHYYIEREVGEHEKVYLSLTKKISGIKNETVKISTSL